MNKIKEFDVGDEDELLDAVTKWTESDEEWDKGGEWVVPNSSMTDEEYESMKKTERLKMFSAYISKENGEIIRSIYFDLNDHWKAELADLCHMAIEPMLKEANMTFEQACDIGKERHDKKVKHNIISSVVDGNLKDK